MKMRMKSLLALSLTLAVLASCGQPQGVEESQGSSVLEGTASAAVTASPSVAPSFTPSEQAVQTPVPTPTPEPTPTPLASPVTYSGEVSFLAGKGLLSFTMSSDWMTLTDIRLDYGDYGLPGIDNKGGRVIRKMKGGEYSYPGEVTAKTPGHFVFGKENTVLSLDVECTEGYASGQIAFQTLKDWEAAETTEDLRDPGEFERAEAGAIFAAKQAEDENLYVYGRRQFVIPIEGNEEGLPQALLDEAASFNRELLTFRSLSLLPSGDAWILVSSHSVAEDGTLIFLSNRQEDWFAGAELTDLRAPEQGAQLRQSGDVYNLVEGESLIMTVRKDGADYRRDLRLGDVFAYVVEGEDYKLVVDDSFMLVE